MKKVVVTGANGFVGSWLCRELSNNNINVTAIVRNKESDITEIKMLPNINIVYCSLDEIKKLPEKISEKDYDVFFHLGWEGAGGESRKDYSIQLMNTIYSCDCVEVAKKLGCNRFLVSGTITEEIAKGILCINAKADNLIYGLSKYNTHCMIDVLCNMLEIDYVWMQFSNIYGPGSVNGNIVGYTITELIRGNSPEFSKGEQPYDLLYVKDLVRAIYLLAKAKNLDNCYYIGSGNSRKLKDYLISIAKIYGQGCKIKLGARKEDGLQYKSEWFNIDSISKDVGFKCNYSFEMGIKETIKWIKENIDYGI